MRPTRRSCRPSFPVAFEHRLTHHAQGEACVPLQPVQMPFEARDPEVRGPAGLRGAAAGTAMTAPPAGMLPAHDAGRGAGLHAELLPGVRQSARTVPRRRTIEHIVALAEATRQRHHGRPAPRTPQREPEPEKSDRERPASGRRPVTGRGSPSAPSPSSTGCRSARRERDALEGVAR